MRQRLSPPVSCPAADARLLRLGLPDDFPHVVGSSDYLRRTYGLAAPKIAEAVLDALRA